MQENITVHGNPQNSVFGLKGSDVSTDEGKFYVKISNDSTNIGWKEILPTPTPTQTVSVTPTKTIIVTRTPAPNPSSTLPPTPTPTPTGTPSVSPTSAPGTSPTPTCTPTGTSFRTSIKYKISPTAGGDAVRVDGPTPTGYISVGTGTMQLKATPYDGYSFVRWIVPEAVRLSDPYSLNPIASGFNTFADVDIIAEFNVIYNGPFRIDGYADSYGRLIFAYINAFGVREEYNNDTLAPGEIVWGAACGLELLDISLGNADLLRSEFC